MYQSKLICIYQLILIWVESIIHNLSWFQYIQIESIQFSSSWFENNKELIRLAMSDSQELQETAHVKSYGVDTSTKYIRFYVHILLKSELPGFLHELFPATPASQSVLT